MDTNNDYSLLLSFSKDVEDFRTGNRLYYPACSIVFMAFVGVLCGAEDWDDVVEISEASEDLLVEFLGSDFVGVPSHDTFSRFFSLVKPDAMERAFRKTMGVIHAASVGTSQSVIAIDGKYAASVTDESALNIVSAYSTLTGLCLGQEVADKKMNEPQVLRKIVEELDVKGHVITADALHCQKKSVESIIKAGADYLIIVKSNQKKLYAGILEGIRTENIRNKPLWIDHAQEVAQGHGREETRTCHSCSHSGWLPKCGMEWEGIKSFGTITCERIMLSTGKTSIETRCFISSLEKDALKQMKMIREHWKIENNLHWQLDVSFGEDYTRMKKNQLMSISILRKMAMPVIKEFNYKKGASMKKKMLAAALKQNIRKNIIKAAMEFYNKS